MKYVVVALDNLEFDDYQWKKGANYSVEEKDGYVLLACESKVVMANYESLECFEKIKSIPAIAFESVKRKGKYVSDGPDEPSMDENGEAEDLEDALLVIRNDFKKPELKDIDDMYEFFSALKFFDYEEFRKMSRPIEVKITQEQLAIVRERNEW